MNHPSSNGFYTNVVVGVTILFGSVATLLDSYIVSPEHRTILFFSLVAISIVSHSLIIEQIKQREERNKQQILQQTERNSEGSTTSEEFQDMMKKNMEVLTEMKSQLQNFSDKFPQTQHIHYGDYTMSGDQFKTRDIISSPGTNVGHDNTSVANSIQQMPDSNNKSVLLQLQEEIRQNHKLSPQEKEYALNQIKVLAELPITRLTPTQRHIASHARDFFIGFAAGMFANLVSKFVIPA